MLTQLRQRLAQCESRVARFEPFGQVTVALGLEHAGDAEADAADFHDPIGVEEGLAVPAEVGVHVFQTGRRRDLAQRIDATAELVGTHADHVVAQGRGHQVAGVEAKHVFRRKSVDEGGAPCEAAEGLGLAAAVVQLTADGGIEDQGDLAGLRGGSGRGGETDREEESSDETQDTHEEFSCRRPRVGPK